MDLSTFNCRGLGDSAKRRSIFGWLKKYHKGIIFLQETHTTENIIKIWESEWNGQVYMSHGSSTARGVAILISPNIDIIIKEIKCDSAGRLILLETIFEGQTLILVNIYAPTKDKKNAQLDFIKYIQQILLEYMDKHIMLGGDFNICLQPEIDKKGGTLEKQSESAVVLESIMDEFNLIDVWRLYNPNTLRFSRREMSKNGLVQSRIDYWLISNHLLYDYTCQDIKPGIRSDHSIVTLKFEIKNSIKNGRGFFKFNCSLLKDTVYVEKINNLIDNYIKQNKNDPNIALKWDYLKCDIRGATISYASYKSKQKHKLTTELKNRLDFLEKKLNDENMLEYKTVKKGT